MTVMMTGCQTMNDGSYLDYVPLDDITGTKETYAPAERTINTKPIISMETPSRMSIPPSAEVPLFREKRSPTPPPAAEKPVKTTLKQKELSSSAPNKTLPAARITHVNLKDKYVILQCEKLPKPGEDAQIFRGTEQVGIVRFVSSRKGRYIVADIVEGEPQRGDIARYKCIFPPEEKPKKAGKKKKRGNQKKESGFKLFF